MAAIVYYSDTCENYWSCWYSFDATHDLSLQSSGQQLMFINLLLSNTWVTINNVLVNKYTSLNFLTPRYVVKVTRKKLSNDRLLKIKNSPQFSACKPRNGQVSKVMQYNSRQYVKYRSLSTQKTFFTHKEATPAVSGNKGTWPPGGGGLAYERGGYACRLTWGCKF